MKKHNVILHIINNTYKAVLVEYVDSEYCSDYPTWESFRGFQNSAFYDEVNVIDENYYDSFEDSELWMCDDAFDADITCM